MAASTAPSSPARTQGAPCASPRTRPALMSSGRPRSSGHRGADVGPDFAAMVVGLGKEFGPLRRPLRVGRADVRDPDVEECAGMAGVSRRRERQGGLVIYRAAA